MNCPKCKQPIDDADAKFCPKCGADIQAASTWTCTKCGQVNPRSEEHTSELQSRE